jgi:acyl-CoA synthetase (AMP-forming)/AMP-acid ligase II
MRETPPHSMMTLPDGTRLSDLLASHPDLPALRDGPQVLSRAELRDGATRAARGLQQLGLRRGDALAVWLPNGAAWLQLLFAAAELGVLVVPVSTRYKAPEIAHLLKVSRARLLVFANKFLDQDNAPVAQGLLAELPTLEQVLGLDDPFGLIVFDQAGAVPTDPTTDRPTDRPSQALGQPTDLLCCFSTSGTTGQPKLAAHDHASIARHAGQVARAMNIHAGDAMLCALPLFGVFGFMTALAALAGGASCDLMPVFDAQAAARAVAQQRISHAVGADAMFDPIFRVEGADFSSLRHVVLADFAGLSLQVTQRADELGILCSGTYGSSEVFALMSLQDWAGPVEQRALSGGTPLDPAISIRIADPQTGQALADGSAGELQLRGPNVLAQYLNNPGATAQAMTADGWFRSGDLASAQGQNFHYLARMGDSLRLRGYLVSPAEIEQALMRHPAVTLAQVVGVALPGLGDQAVAFVVLAQADPGEAALRAHCLENMASYKVPQRVVVLSAFPTLDGPNGVKIQKRVLREMASQLLTPTTA